MDGDGLLHPRGPLPPETYWRRRAIVAVAAIALIFLVVQCAFGGGGGKDAKKKKASSSSSASESTSSTAKPTAKPTTSTSSPQPSTSPKPSTPAKAKPTPTPTASAPATPQPCQPPSLKVSVKTGSATYAAGVSPVITMTITNSGAAPCVRDLGPGAIELKITSGADRIWSSDDCVKDTAKKLTVLKAGEVKPIPVTWNRKRSTATGDCIGADAKSGNYRVEGRLGDLVTAQYSFLLS